jgi:hypothetical protein
MDATGSSMPSPARTNTGQIKSLGVSDVWRTMARKALEWRNLRGRAAGNDVMVGFMVGAPCRLFHWVAWILGCGKGHIEKNNN